jgi:hypothetical protein
MRVRRWRLMVSHEILGGISRLESNIREINGFLIDNPSGHHIARCTWAGNILRVAPGDQLELKVGIIGLEIVAGQGWS